MVTFTLYSRSYCHLCDDMLTALQGLSDEFTFKLFIVDIDADAALVALYDESVPVLMGNRKGETVRLCHYFLDEVTVRAFLAGAYR